MPRFRRQHRLPSARRCAGGWRGYARSDRTSSRPGVGPGGVWRPYGRCVIGHRIVVRSCGRRTAAPAARSGPLCRASAVPMCGGRPGPTGSTAPVWSNGPTRRPVCTSDALPTNRSTTVPRCRARRLGPVTWCFRTPGTCKWRSATISWSRRPTRALRCGSADWAPTCRFGGPGESPGERRLTHVGIHWIPDGGIPGATDRSGR